MIKQLFRRYSDGTLVLKDEIYPIVEMYQFVQENLDSIWMINHNKNTMNFIEQIYVNNELVRADVDIIDGNNIKITFTRPLSGIVNILFMKN